MDRPCDVDVDTIAVTFDDDPAPTEGGMYEGGIGNAASNSSPVSLPLLKLLSVMSISKIYN